MDNLATMFMKTMDSTSLQSLPLPFSGKPRGRVCGRVYAAKRDAAGRDKWHQSRRLVDENMIVLRMRIQEMKTVEGNQTLPLRNWMEWEKKWYASYYSHVFEAVGLLQNLLLESRPSLVLAMVALWIISASTSLSLLLYYLVRMFSGINY